MKQFQSSTSKNGKLMMLETHTVMVAQSLHSLDLVLASFSMR